jgi:hypothetical protein
MLEAQAQLVLVVRAFEEADREGRILNPYARATATRRALRVTGLADSPAELRNADSQRYSETVIRRARVLFESLDRKIPGLRNMVKIARLGMTTAPAVIAFAFVAGLLTNVLGPQRQINLLSLPLLGMLGWNLAIYAAMLAAPVVKPARHLRRLGPWLADRFLRGALWRRLHVRKMSQAGNEEWAGVAGKALMRFAVSWHGIAGALLTARVRRTLHVAAAALVLGAILGMYVRGLGFEYRATWESTWLDAPAVQRILGIVLGPAAFLLGVDVPAVAPLQGPGGGGDAAPWIHLYAVIALVYVVIPRALLALVECWRCRVLVDLDVDLRDAYFRRVFTEWRGATRHVEIVPYGYTPSETVLGALRTLLHDYFGARADIRVRAPLAYGDEVSKIETIPRSSRQPWAPAAAHREELADPERESCHVVLFNLAQSPESEVHGSFLRELVSRLDDGRGRLLVLVDGSAYRERVTDPERWKERFRSWERVVREADLALLQIDPQPAVVDSDALDALGAALWRSSEAGG